MSFGLKDSDWVYPDEGEKPYNGPCSDCSWFVECPCGCGFGYCSRTPDEPYAGSQDADECWDADVM